MVKINFQDYPSFQQEVVLDNDSYVLNFNWNSRGGFWDFSILDTLLNPILQGLKVVLNYPLTRQFKYKDIPQGEFYAVDASGDGSRIEQNDFVNGRVSFIYLTEAELNS